MCDNNFFVCKAYENIGEAIWLGSFHFKFYDGHAEISFTDEEYGRMDTQWVLIKNCFHNSVHSWDIFDSWCWSISVVW